MWTNWTSGSVMWTTVSVEKFLQVSVLLGSSVSDKFEQVLVWKTWTCVNVKNWKSESVKIE